MQRFASLKSTIRYNSTASSKAFKGLPHQTFIIIKCLKVVVSHEYMLRKINFLYNILFAWNYRWHMPEWLLDPTLKLQKNVMIHGNTPNDLKKQKIFHFTDKLSLHNMTASSGLRENIYPINSLLKMLIFIVLLLLLLIGIDVKSQ